MAKNKFVQNKIRVAGNSCDEELFEQFIRANIRVNYFDKNLVRNKLMKCKTQSSYKILVSLLVLPVL